MHALLRPISMLFLAALLTVQAASGKTLSDRSEKAIVDYVKTQQEPAVALLEKAVDINSGTMNFAGVRAVGDLFRPRFDALGFKTTWVDGAAFGRAGHLVAERKGITFKEKRQPQNGRLKGCARLVAGRVQNRLQSNRWVGRVEKDRPGLGGAEVEHPPSAEKTGRCSQVF